MLYVAAVLLPPLAMLLCGKPIQAIVSLILQVTILGWIPASIWAFVVVQGHEANRGAGVSQVVDDDDDAPDELEVASGVTFERNGNVRLNITSVDQAQTALKELKLRKRELGIEKKEVAAGARELHAAHTDRQRRRGAPVRGRGGMARFMRAMEAGSKAGDRQTLAKNLAPHERVRAQLDQMILTVDRAILQVEGYLAKNGG